MEWVLLIFATFFASTVQAMTGFAFGLLATSAFLLMLNSAGAIHLVIIITLIMCLYIWPKIRHDISKPYMIWLSLGSLAGFPIGILVYKMMDLQSLKLAVAIFILILTAQMSWQMFKGNRKAPGSPDVIKKDSKAMTAFVGIVSGTLSTCLAMPGPVVMIYLSRSQLTKDQIRATILSFFIVAYIGALAIQIFVVGIETVIFEKALVLSIPTIAGVHVGHYISKLMNPDVFRIVVLLLLASTGTFMLTTILM